MGNVNIYSAGIGGHSNQDLIVAKHGESADSATKENTAPAVNSNAVASAYARVNTEIINTCQDVLELKKYTPGSELHKFILAELAVAETNRAQAPTVNRNAVASKANGSPPNKLGGSDFIYRCGAGPNK